MVDRAERGGGPTLQDMEILLWLVPSAVVTVLAMAWAGWRGHERSHEVDEETRVSNLARAMAKELPRGPGLPVVPRERSTGVAVRPSRSRA